MKPQNSLPQKIPIICVGLPAWEGDYLKSTVQLMTELAQNREVLYVEYTYTLNDVLKSFFTKNSIPIKRILGIESRLRKIELENKNEIFVLTLPPILPINWIKNKLIYSNFLRINTQIISKAINREKDALKIHKPLIINAFQPNYGLYLKGKLDEKATIYYCYDEISAANWCKKHGAWAEEKFMKITDAVVVSSKALFESKSKVQPTCFLVKNGVDTRIFSQSKKMIFSEKKTIGYVGSIDDRLDSELLRTMVEKFQKYNFLFVGRVVDKAILNQFYDFPNVKFVGAKQPKELAEYMKLIDVGLIPFKKNEFTKNIYPLKINEYLASGMPVLSTDFADLSDFKGLIYEANATDFCEVLEQVLNENSEEIIEKRVEFAKQNSWKNRAAEFEKIMEGIQ